MPKEFQVFQEFPRGLVGISLIIFREFGHNLGPETLESQPNPLKTRMIA